MLLRPNFGALGVILAKKIALKNASEKGAPTRRKQVPMTQTSPYSPARRLSDRQPLSRIVRAQTIARTQVEAIVRVFA